jgi:hypothetical protein
MKRTEVKLCDFCKERIATDICAICNADCCKIHTKIFYLKDIKGLHVFKINTCKPCQDKLTELKMEDYPQITLVNLLSGILIKNKLLGEENAKDL